MQNKKKIIILTGPTASGKSKIAEKLRNKNINIINADSKQIYKQIPIITSQPLITSIHKMYGYIDISQYYSVAIWIQDIKKTIEETFKDKKIPLIVGGSGMYVSAIVNGISYTNNTIKYNKKDFINKYYNKNTKNIYQELKNIDPIAAEKLHPNDIYRIQHALFIKGTTGKSITEINQHHKPINKNWIFEIYTTMPTREELYNNINQKVLEFFDMGAVKEVLKIIDKNISNEAEQSIGLQEIIKYIKQEINIENTILSIQKRTRNYAKRQITWIKNQLPNAKIINNSDMIHTK